MGWFDKILGSEAEEEKNIELRLGPLDLSIVSTVSFDSILKMLLSGKSVVQIPDGEIPIHSDAFIDLAGDAECLCRYYLGGEDDGYEQWVQIHTVVNGDDHQIKSITFFTKIFDSEIDSDSDERLECTIAPWPLIGKPTYVHEGIEYVREWGAEAAQTELLPLFEDICSATESFSIKHRSVLYSRDIGLTNRREFLLFSLEGDDAKNPNFHVALGVSLYQTDLHVAWPGPDRYANPEAFR